jgi:hypothetical protein
VFCQTYSQALIDATRATRSLLPTIVLTAEHAASRLLNGGNLYIASARPDFGSEGYIRSGGLMMLQEYDPACPPTSNDVVIAGWSERDSEHDRQLLSQLTGTGTLVIGIGPKQNYQNRVDALLPSDPPHPVEILSTFDNELYPLVSLQNLMLLWSLTGELTAALTRSDQMPVMYQSVLVPRARKRNASFGTSRFHPTHTVPRVPVEQLGRAYLDKISTCLQALSNEASTISQVAADCAETLNGGNQIHAFLISHFPVHQAGAPGDPGYMTPMETLTGETPDSDELARKLEENNLFFFLGYYRRPAQAYEIARRRGCKIVEVITGMDEPDTTGPTPDHIIRPGWHYTDSLVDVPGYDVRILPASGIVQTAVYWSVIGQIKEYLSPSSSA